MSELSNSILFRMQKIPKGLRFVALSIIFIYEIQPWLTMASGKIGVIRQIETEGMFISTVNGE